MDQAFPIIIHEKATEIRMVATRDHDIIRRWADRFGAEPATGEASGSGPATVHVEDSGSGLRFNFPGAGRFRPVSWTEWFTHFDQRRLLFLFEDAGDNVASRAYELWQRRGGTDGHDLRDWFDAESELRVDRGNPWNDSRYRVIRGTDIEN
jgi:hypothetical protein